MKRPARIGLTTRALLAVNVVLALTIALQLAYPVRSADTAAAASADASELLPDFGDGTVDTPAMADLADLLERSLFCFWCPSSLFLVLLLQTL